MSNLPPRYIKIEFMNKPDFNNTGSLSNCYLYGTKPKSTLNNLIVDTISISKS